MKGRRIILTGASEGIGRALALALAAHGARLALAARDRDRLESLAQECRGRSAEALAVPTDVTNQQDLEWLVSETLKGFGGIDVVVHNAGITMWSRFDALTDLSIFERLMEVNYFAPVRLTQLALPHLKRSRGLIVAVASLAGLTGVPERSGYAASKHAMIGFFDSLRIELAGSGVDVSVIAPDFVVSEIHKRAIGPDGEPLGASPMVQSKIMSAEACAARIVRAMQRRQRQLLMSTRGKLGQWLKVIAPAVIDRMAAKAIRQRH
ncbi:MAG TPA: SDR family oxidoreductase [Steroidobacteraceae bacterium]|jgi:short-subunit dehydrogenase|nr:SDR family oxidoreductase [Steroidobacteraceae bacterium]